MKILFLLFLIALFQESDIPFEKFINEVPEGWSYKTDVDTLKIIRNDSIEIIYCGPSQSGMEFAKKRSYEIIIERTRLLSKKEINKRRFLQDSILHVLKRNYRNKPDKGNASDLMSFEFRKNKIDTLRLPFYCDHSFSYFNYTNLPWGHCYIDSAVKDEIDKVNRKYEIKD